MDIVTDIGEPPPYCDDLVTHIQETAEDAKARLARVLHDDVGGLIVAALMDLVWVESHLSTHPAVAGEKLRRIEGSLRAAIDLERQIIEELRPTLLDHVGLFAALRWQLNVRCKKAGIRCVDRLPAGEWQVTPAAAIALYRIAEELLDLLLKYAAPTHISLEISVRDAHIRMCFEDDVAPDLRTKAEHQSLAALHHRITLLGGELKLQDLNPKGSRLLVLIPAARVLMPESGGV
jgi:protein-histidine pros-kinase